ncbi:MAG: hypothetical protein AAGF94_04985 [Pseudomonadota bacterium]
MTVSFIPTCKTVSLFAVVALVTAFVVVEASDLTGAILPTENTHAAPEALKEFQRGLEAMDALERMAKLEQ